MALGLSFCIKADFIFFSYNKGISGVFTTELSIMTWFRQPMSQCPQVSKVAHN